MNRRLVSVLIFALIVASATSFLLYRLVLVRVRSQGPTVATNRLVVANHDLQVGALIADSDLNEVAWSGPVPGDAVKTRPDAIGRGVIATIFQNEPILQGRLATRGAGAGMAATIPIGMRAVGLRVNEVVGLDGFVVPGMRVDVLMAGNAPSETPSRTGTVCRTILQNIEVLSAGQKLDKTNDGKPETAQVVNLLVTPEQAEILNLASSEAKVQLVLRNPLDTKSQPTPGTSIGSLFGLSPSAPLVAEVQAPRFPPPTIVRVSLHHEREVATVEVFHGVKKSQETFDVPVEKK